MGLLDILRAVFALAVTLGLIGLAAVAARRYAPEWLGRLQNMKRDRRLSIVETLPLDPSRRLVLVRMDDTERLILLGDGRMLAEGPAPAPKPPPVTPP
jgi:flagellar protein FliO/FliZ